MEWIKDLAPFIVPLVTFLGGLFVERRMRDASAAKTEAEAHEAYARARKTLSESESIEAQAMADALGAWQEIAEARNEEAQQTKQEAEKARQESERARREAGEANARSKATEQKYNVVLAHAERLEDLLSLAVTFIDTLVARMQEANITPPAMPKQLTDWVSERNGGGKS